MTSPDSPEALAFRLERLSKAPRNWCFWVAAFTAMNGVFLLTKSAVLIPAALIFPYAAGLWLHFVSGAVLATMGYLGQSMRGMYVVALVIYLLDAVFCAFGDLWFGVVVHAIVLALVGFALNGVRIVKRQMSAQSTVTPSATQ
jgi:hypothetical protein